MKKIRLNERDLTKVIERVIYEMDDIAGTHPSHGDTWYDRDDLPMDMSRFSSRDERSFGPGEYDDFMDYINNCDTNWCMKTKADYDQYTSKGRISVRKGRYK